METRNFANKVLLCIKSQGLFEENKYYFCFADEGHVFWIHAPFLVDRIGVDQIKAVTELRNLFITKDEYYQQQNKKIGRWKPLYIAG